MSQRSHERKIEPESGPWVNIATLCQRLDQGGTLGASLIGLVSRATIGVPAAAKLVESFEVVVDLLLVLGLSGGRPGRIVDARIDIDGADGMRRPGGGLALRFDDYGSLVQQFKMTIALWGPQRYWVNVLLDERLLTRVPVTVSYEFLAA